MIWRMRIRWLPNHSRARYKICDSPVTNSFLEHVISAHLEEDTVDCLLDQLSSSNAIIQGCLDSKERGTMEWNSRMVEQYE